MIADLVPATGGRLSEEASAGLMAHFEDSWQALVAAKRIQTSIFDFRSYRPAEGLGAAILIYQPAPDYPAGLAARTLRLATPGQILLAQSVSQHLLNLPGIELRIVPALTTDGGEQTGLVELVFDSPKQGAVLPPASSRATAPRPAADRRDDDRSISVSTRGASGKRNLPGQLGRRLFGGDESSFSIFRIRPQSRFESRVGGFSREFEYPPDRGTRRSWAAALHSDKNPPWGRRVGCDYSRDLCDFPFWEAKQKSRLRSSGRHRREEPKTGQNNPGNAGREHPTGATRATDSQASVKRTSCPETIRCQAVAETRDRQPGTRGTTASNGC